MDAIKEVPGYKVILKAVLKSQIQQLVEQLSRQADEESVILTASVSDGSLSHLGSQSGKSFLQNNEELKTQFLGFCLKRHHRLTLKKKAENQQTLNSRSSSSKSPTGAGGIHRKSVVRGDSLGIHVRPPGFRHEPYRRDQEKRRESFSNISPSHEPSLPDWNISGTVSIGGDYHNSQNDKTMHYGTTEELSNLELTTCCSTAKEMVDGKTGTASGEQASLVRTDMNIDAIEESLIVKIESVADGQESYQGFQSGSRNENMMDVSVNLEGTSTRVNRSNIGQNFNYNETLMEAHQNNVLECSDLDDMLSDTSLDDLQEELRFEDLTVKTEVNYDIDELQTTGLEWLQRVESVQDSSVGKSNRFNIEKTKTGSSSRSGHTSNQNNHNRMRLLRNKKRKKGREKTNRDGQDIEDEIESSENSCQPELSQGIQIQTSKSKTGKFTEKRRFCMFCKKLCTKVSRHIANMHADKLEVAKALSYPKKSAERKQAFAELTAKGNFIHNTQVLEEGKGVFIPKRRTPRACYTDHRYLPCEFCREHYVAEYLWRHHKSCPSKPTGVKSDGAMRNSRLVMPLPISVTEAFNKSVISKMRDDMIALKVKTDPLILKFGERKFFQSRTNEKCGSFIAQRLRELGRLLIALNKRNSSITSLSECLTCKHWNTFIDTVKELSEFDATTLMFSKPSLALHLGSSVKKCARLLKNEALKDENTNLEESVNKFLIIFEEDWCELISSQALESQAKMKFATITYLTLAEDVSKLSKYISDEINKITSDNENTDVGEKYGQLASLCLAQVVMFNGKRAGAAQLLQLDAYKQAVIQQNEVDEEVKNKLTIFEQKLCENHFRIETIDSKGRKVILLLTNDMREHLDTLTKLYNELGLKTKYMFQKPKTDSPVCGTIVLHEYAEEAGLKHASRITSSSLRKQLSTTSQVLGLTEKSEDIIKKCIGHDLLIKKDFYQMPKTALEIAKITKVVHALNSGTLADVAGKTLDDIDAMEPVEIEIANEEEEDDDDPFGHKDTADSDANWQPSKKTGMSSRASSSGSSIYDSDSDSDVILPEEPKRGNKKKIFKRRPWTPAEKKVVETGLKRFFDKKQLPGKFHCEKLISKHDVLKRRSWTMVKGYVRTTLKSRAKQLSMLQRLPNRSNDLNHKADGTF